MGFVIACAAATTQPEPTKEMLIYYGMAPSLSTGSPERLNGDIPLEKETLINIHLVAPNNPSARWEQFESEFGLQEKKTPGFKGTVEAAIYQVDRAMFAVKDFVEHRLNFDCEVRNIGHFKPGPEPPHHRGGNPFWNALESAHLKSGVSLSSIRTHHFTVKLVIPLGD